MLHEDDRNGMREVGARKRALEVGVEIKRYTLKI
jgi:hypothetical protein